MPATPSTKSKKPPPSLPGYSSFSLELISGHVEPDPENKFTSAFNQFVPDTNNTNPNARPRKPRKPYKKALMPNRGKLRHPWEQHLSEFQSTSTSMPALALGSAAQVLSQFGQAQVLSQFDPLSGGSVGVNTSLDSWSQSQISTGSGVLSSSTCFNQSEFPQHDYMRPAKRSQALSERPSPDPVISNERRPFPVPEVNEPKD